MLAPGGRLLVTLDNASNPLVAVRNAIPWRWLASIRLVPCYVGATCSAAGLENGCPRRAERPENRDADARAAHGRPRPRRRLVRAPLALRRAALGRAARQLPHAKRHGAVRRRPRGEARLDPPDSRAPREQGIRGVWFGGARPATPLPPARARRAQPPAAARRSARRRSRSSTRSCHAAGRAGARPARRAATAASPPGKPARVVSSRWIAGGRALRRVPRHVARRSSDEDVYLSETYTEPSMRGQGVSGAAGTRLAAALAAEGKRRIVAGVLAENHAGTRAYEKAGYRARRPNRLRRARTVAAVVRMGRSSGMSGGS